MAYLSHVYANVSLHSSLETTTKDVPLNFHGKSNKFSEHLMHSGMHRNHSLNTSMDKSPV